MMQPVSVLAGLTAVAAALSGCLTDPVDGRPDIQPSYSLGGCAGCGLNGMDEAAFVGAKLALGRATLDHFNLWSAETGGPRSLCVPETSTGRTCQARAQWDAWIDQVPSASRLFRFLVKVVAPASFSVVGGDDEYRGDFGLVQGPLTEPWTSEAQDTITGGLSALFNRAAVREFEVCLRTSTVDPNGCSDDYQYVESIFYGSLFSTSRQERSISGGPDAPDPLLNLRTGSTETPLLFDRVHRWEEGACVMSGSGSGRWATVCDGTWTNPVTVLTNFPPSTWYYDTGGEPLPPP